MLLDLCRRVSRYKNDLGITCIMDDSTPIGLRRVYNISTLADTLHRVTSVTPLSGADIAGIQQGTLSHNICVSVLT